MTERAERRMSMPSVDSAIAEAEAHYRNGQYQAAAALLVPVASDQQPTALRILGLCQLKLGAATEGLALLQKAHRLAPGDPWAQLHYGIGLQTVGRTAEAVPLFRACLQALPTDPAPSLNLAAALLGLGDLRGAGRAARRARLYAPTMAQTHYTLGLVYLAAGYNERATDCFRAATKRAPQFSAAWLNLGVAQYRNRKIEAAKQSMRSALQADPGNVAAAANLSAFMRLTGEGEAGEALLRQLVEQYPQAVTARINLAVELLHEERAAEALALLDGPPPADAHARQHWLLQYALALIKLRRLQEARATLESIGAVPPNLQPLLTWRTTLLALEEGNVGRARSLAGEMEAELAAEASMLPEHQIMSHYDLGRFWSGLGDADRAFPHWIAGHRLLGQFQPFSRSAYTAFVKATIETFDRTRLLHGARAGNHDPAPVFIVGMPRSGTTLVEQILSAHPLVHGAGERVALGQTFWQLGGASENPTAVHRIAALDAPALDAVASRYLAELHALAPEAERIIDKMPGNFRHLGLAALLMPGARIISCDRDPRDIGLSIFTYRFYGFHNYAHDLSDLGWYIGQQKRLMAHWRSALPNPIMTIKLQDWVDDFSGTLRRLLEFLDLPYDPACENYHKVPRRVRTVSRNQVREPINARGIGRWRPYSNLLAPLIEALDESGALADV